MLISVIVVAGCTSSTNSQNSQITTNIQQTPKCTPQWECSNWSNCSSFGTQTRTCIDKNICGVLVNKPSESQSCTPPVIEPGPIILTGNGQEATEKFKLENGLSIFYMQHDGTSNFAIWLLDNSGDRIDLLVNAIGSFDGSKAVGINNPGDYVLDILADGNWNINIEQPRPKTSTPIPKVLIGRGQKATEMFYLNTGLVRFKMKHDGSSNFAIWLLDNKGNRIDLLVNQIGTFDGSKALGITQSGVYLLDILAGGNWEISIE